MKTCERCHLEKNEVEFNTLTRYQRPVREPFAAVCVTCYWNQMRTTDSWQSVVKSVRMRLGYVDAKEVGKFGIYSLDQLTRPFTDWLLQCGAREELI